MLTSGHFREQLAHFYASVLGWFFSSAKDNINVEDAAKFLVQKIIDNDKWSAHGARSQLKYSTVTVQYSTQQ
jgi:hypothetical protein